MTETTLQAPEETNTEALRPPRIHTYWQGQGGIYAGARHWPAIGKDVHLILPTDPRAFTRGRLGTYGTEVEGASCEHDGLANTIALAKAGSQLCQQALDLEIEGHKDFYLTSSMDARLLFATLPGKFKKAWHLTSTQYSALTAWVQYFVSGYTLILNKDFEAEAVFVRRLIL